MESVLWLKKIKTADVHTRTVRVMETVKLVMHITTEIPIAKSIKWFIGN